MNEGGVHPPAWRGAAAAQPGPRVRRGQAPVCDTRQEPCRLEVEKLGWGRRAAVKCLVGSWGAAAEGQDGPKADSSRAAFTAAEEQLPSGGSGRAGALPRPPPTPGPSLPLRPEGEHTAQKTMRRFQERGKRSKRAKIKEKTRKTKE